ncbi:MAG: flagellar hook-associated protein FlgK [bacterium]
MGLLESLGIGVRGLSASQLALNVTSQNISNANTEGYSRKRLTLTPEHARDETFGQRGFGVDVKNITRVRDFFIDKQINKQTQTLGYYEEIDDTLERIENIFGEPNDVGFNHILEEFWNGWQDLANNPEDIAARNMVKARANVLIDNFHNLAREMDDLMTAKSESLQNIVEVINNYAKDIMKLNQEIAVIELNEGQKANDSRDKRDLVLRELAKLIDVDAIEDERGTITVLSAGSILVSATSTSPIEVHTELQTSDTGEKIPSVGLRFANSKRPYHPQSGKLAGLFYSRDKVVPFYQQKLDDIASTMVSEVNGLHEHGYTLDGRTGIYFFEAPQPNPVNPAVSLPIKASTIKLSAAINQNVTNIAAAEGGKLSDKTSVFHPIDPFTGNPIPEGLTLGNFVYLNKLNRELVGRDTVTVVDTTANGMVLTEGSDYTIDYDNGRIAFLNPTLIAPGAEHTIDINYKTSASGSRGVGDNANALSIAMLRQKSVLQPDSTGNFTATLGTYYASFIGTLGVDRNEATADVKTREFLLEQMDNRQAEIAGVNLNEELSNLIKYEHTFQASARMMSTVNDMLDVLMNI